MKWNEVPDGASLAMSKETAMEMRGSRKGPFIVGAICGASLILALQSCGADNNTKQPDPKPGPAATKTHKPGN